MNHHVTIS